MTWREVILQQFPPQVARLTLVADPDGLLAEEGILEGIRHRGYDLIEFADPIAFRYAYEARYRAHWDRGEATDLVVALRSPAADLRALPYDLLQAGRQLAFNLGDLFPHLSYAVVEALDRADLDALYRAQEHERPGPLGESATKDFVLRHVFGVAPELVKQPVDLLRLLLQRHYRGRRVPRTIDQRLLAVLRQNPRLAEWPLEQILPDREAFFAFLQERWPIFLEQTATGQGPLHEAGAQPGLEYPGPASLPFDDGDVRAYVDTLFADGLLQPVRSRHAAALAGQWMVVGLRVDPRADLSRRLARLAKRVAETLPGVQAAHQEWLGFAPRWAEHIALAQVAGRREELAALQEQVDAALLAWAQGRYAGLHNQPVPPAAMVHHAPRVLEAELAAGAERVALVVVDGLALDQWVAMRGVLAAQRPGLRLREGAAFAWLPTITPVSRQSIFAGRPPLYYPLSVHTTDKEGALWEQFWADHGLPGGAAYLRGLGGSGDLARVEELLAEPKLRAVGLVVDKVDKIMHGMELGTAGMHNQVRQWAEQGFMAALLDLLLGQGYTVYLTSDHGNVEAVGCGSPAEGAVADLRGARARVYPDPVLRAQVKAHFPGAIEWPPVGLPEGNYPLLAGGRSAFVAVGQRVVAHGGITVEELIVPFIRIEERRR